jgi:hypothetical protein
MASKTNNRGFQLPVCPFSVFVFVTTVILVTRQKRKLLLQQQQEQHTSKCTTATDIITNNEDPVMMNNTVPLYVVFVLGPPGVGTFVMLWLTFLLLYFYS